MKYTINNLTAQLKKDIKKVVGEFKNEDDMQTILKLRLTKKEFKYYRLRSIDATLEEMIIELNCDKKRVDSLEKQLLLKINQEKLKNELMA
jgi:DNA-directed RNA polymerase sigma subunit (sigma70/sigma32)